METPNWFPHCCQAAEPQKEAEKTQETKEKESQEEEETEEMKDESSGGAMGPDNWGEQLGMGSNTNLKKVRKGYIRQKFIFF